ncbi:MAG: L,D-transpeptidase family protein [Candidatus Omnitrophica bacterium]|nr:L,D-transpeptidase family protein [Candidatus Omnitrophota bacterium]
MRSWRIMLIVVVGSLAMLTVGCDRIAGKVKAPASPADEMARQAELLLGEGKKQEAKAAYQQIIAEYPDYKNIEMVQEALYRLNMDIIFSNMQTPQTVMHEVLAGDTLGKISKKYGVTMELIKICNGMKTDTVRLGQKLRIWTGKFTLHADKSQNILMLKSGDEIMKIYHVSTGANNSTPAGTFKIATKLENPVWFKDTGAVIPPESPQNVLGSRWMGFDNKGYGIHGTVDPDKIGQQVTAGCIRMRNEEVEELFKIIPLGTEVVIVD